MFLKLTFFALTFICLGPPVPSHMGVWARMGGTRALAKRAPGRGRGVKARDHGRATQRESRATGPNAGARRRGNAGARAGRRAGSHTRAGAGTRGQAEPTPTHARERTHTRKARARARGEARRPYARTYAGARAHPCTRAQAQARASRRRQARATQPRTAVRQNKRTSEQTCATLLLALWRRARAQARVKWRRAGARESTTRMTRASTPRKAPRPGLLAR